KGCPHPNHTQYVRRTMSSDDTGTSRRAFPFLRLNERPAKPRNIGLTEIRGPYYTSFGPDHLIDLLDSVGPHVDIFKFPGASMPLMSEDTLKKFIDGCHERQVEVSTGGL